MLSELPQEINLADVLLSAHTNDHSIVYFYQNRPLTRKEIRLAAYRYAALFSKQGVSEGDRVVLFLYDTPLFIFSFLALILIGAIPVPVNPKLSAQSALHILTDSRAKFVVAESDQAAKLAESFDASPYLSDGCVFIQDIYTAFSSTTASFSVPTYLLSLVPNFTQPHHFQSCKKAHNSIAFWQYSSGTTGLPKAVQHNQVGMLKNGELFAKGILNISDQDKIYSVPKMFFGYGLGNTLFFPLLTGAQALIDHQWPTLETVENNIKNFNPSIFFAVPSMFNMLLKNAPKECASIKICFSAGATLPETTYTRWKETFNKPILDGIGATEVGHVFLTNSPEDHAPGCTGKPVSGYEIKLINDFGEEAQLEEKGVLFVKGPSVSPGYWEKSKLNQEKFKDGWYRTGDVFIKTHTGHYSYRGREDDLFKVNGRWVIPSEIESFVHEKFPQIKEAVVVKRESEDGTLDPVLFVWSEANEAEKETLSNELIRLIADHFESYKVPKECFVVSELPRNDNGKLMRTHLEEAAQKKESVTLI